LPDWLTVIQVVTFKADWRLEPDDDDWIDLHGVVTWNDYSETIDDLMHSRAGPKYGYTFIERIQEPVQ
jgi:hypothetical protein